MTDGPTDPDLSTRVRLRPMRHEDVDQVVAGQAVAAVAALSSIFPQDEHPFPRGAVSDRWHEEIVQESIDCFVIDDAGAIAGFAALRGGELVHVGVDRDRWGTGVARIAHDALMDIVREAGFEQAQLWVFTGNARARAFYRKLGWRPTGETMHSTFPPRPELQQYVRDLRAGAVSDRRGPR